MCREEGSNLETCSREHSRDGFSDWFNCLFASIIHKIAVNELTIYKIPSVQPYFSMHELFAVDDFKFGMQWSVFPIYLNLATIRKAWTALNNYRTEEQVPR